MKLKFFSQKLQEFNFLVCKRFLMILGCIVFSFLLYPIYAQNNQQTQVNFDVNIIDSWIEIEIILDGNYTSQERKIIITKEGNEDYPLISKDSFGKAKIKFSDLGKTEALNRKGYQINVQYDSWNGAEDALISFVDDATSKLKIESLPLPPDNYTYRANIDDYVNEISVSGKCEIKKGSNKTIPINPPSFWAELKESYGTNENILISIIVGLIGIVITVSKKKIETGINWILDKLGQYGSGKLADRRFTRLYTDVISSQHKYLKLIGSVTPGMSRPLLEEVFVSLRIAGFNQEQSDLYENSESLKKVTDQQSTVSFADAISQYKKMVILGGPGAGKTTTLSHSLLVFLQNKGKEKFGIEKSLLPIFIPLRRLSGKGKSILEDLISKESQILPTDLLDACPVKYFEKRLKKGGCIILLDGLDEVVDEKTHREVAGSINTLVSTYPENYFIVTCRIAGWQSLLSGDFKVLQSQDFSRDEIQHFVLGWHRAVITQAKHTQFELENKDKIKEKDKFEKMWAEHNQKIVKPAIERISKTILGAIEANNRILAIAVNPMLLSLICLIHYFKHILPRGRTILYKQCIELLIDEWDRQRDIVLRQHDVITPVQKETVLREIAFNFQTQGIGEDSRSNLENFIGETAKRLGIGIPSTELLEEIELRSSLLTERSIDVFGFSHLTLQEYLVAKHIQSNPSYRKLLYSNLDKQEWREVLMLYAGLLDDATDLITRITAEDNFDRKILAGYCIGDSQNCDDKVSEVIVDQLLNKLDSKDENDNKEELVNVLSAIAADYTGNAVKAGQKLSEKLINRLQSDIVSAIEPEYTCNWINILGKARIAKSIQVLILYLTHPNTKVRETSVSAIAAIGNASIKEMREFNIYFVRPNKFFELLNSSNEFDGFNEFNKEYGQMKFEETLSPVQWKIPLEKDQFTDFQVASIILGFIQIASEINTGESAKFLTTFYKFLSPKIDEQVSLVLSQMLKNPFVEEDLKHLTDEDFLSIFHIKMLDGNGWYYRNLPTGSVFNHLEQLIRTHISDLIVESRDKVSDSTSFKILLPAIVQVIRNHGMFDDESKESVNVDSVGFKNNADDLLKADLAGENNASLNADQPESEKNLADNNIVEASKWNWASITGNILFSFLVVSIFIWTLYFGYYFLSYPDVFEFLFGILPLLSLIVLGVVVHLTLKRKNLPFRTLSSFFFAFQNFYKILPYFKGRNLWTNYLLLQIGSLVFLPGFIIFARELFYYLINYEPIILEHYFHFYAFLFPNLIFLIASFIYFKFYVLNQKPTVQFEQVDESELKEISISSNFLESFGFKSSEENHLAFLSKQIKRNKSMTVEYALSRGGKVTDVDISTGKNNVNWAAIIGNILFVFLMLSIFIIDIVALNNNWFFITRELNYRDLLFYLWFALPPILFVIILAIFSFRKLNKEFLPKEILASVFFSFQNFHKILPYFTKQKLWLKFIILHFVAFLCSPAAVVSIIILYNYFEYNQKIYWDFAFILLISSPNLVFLIGSFIYLRFYVLKQNPIYQLILLHPEGKRLLNEMR
jgi:hypothetical protein